MIDGFQGKGPGWAIYYVYSNNNSPIEAAPYDRKPQPQMKAAGWATREEK